MPLTPRLELAMKQLRAIARDGGVVEGPIERVMTALGVTSERAAWRLLSKLVTHRSVTRDVPALGRGHVGSWTLAALPDGIRPEDSSHESLTESLTEKGDNPDRGRVTTLTESLTVQGKKEERLPKESEINPDLSFLSAICDASEESLTATRESLTASVRLSTTRDETIASLAAAVERLTKLVERLTAGGSSTATSSPQTPSPDNGNGGTERGEERAGSPPKVTRKPKASTELWGSSSNTETFERARALFAVTLRPGEDLAKKLSDACRYPVEDVISALDDTDLAVGRGRTTAPVANFWNALTNENHVFQERAAPAKPYGSPRGAAWSPDTPARAETLERVRALLASDLREGESLEDKLVSVQGRDYDRVLRSMAHVDLAKSRGLTYEPVGLFFAALTDDAHGFQEGAVLNVDAVRATIEHEARAALEPTPSERTDDESEALELAELEPFLEHARREFDQGGLMAPSHMALLARARNLRARDPTGVASRSDGNPHETTGHQER